MSKTKLKFEYEGNDYTLEFTADSLKKMDKRGFDVSKIEQHILTVNEDLFCGAFIENHDYLAHSVRVDIYHEFAEDTEDGNIDEVIYQMFDEALTELRSHKGNVKWRVAK